jgi:Tol biopolymer transport system component
MAGNFQKVEELYHQALRRSEAERDRFLESACGGDEALRREVENLLAYQKKAGQFLDAPAMDVAARMLARTVDRKLVGSRLGPYEVLSSLGEGGMGEVYLARDSRLERQVAIKVLPADVAEDPERLRRFVREAKAVSALNHPNIATIYEIDEAEGVHYLAMEYVKGETLEARVRRAGLDLPELLDIGLQAAEALQEAHAVGIVHRDIKPANIMVTTRGRVKVLDFGLAKRTQQEQPGEETATLTESRTTPGIIMGTVDYMSPEQVSGREVDQRTDLFSLGVVFYNMLTRRLPFSGATRTDTMYKILHEEPEAIARFNNSAPPELERIVHKCLEKDREVRYQSAREVSIDLKRLKRDSESGKVAAEAMKPKRQPLWLWAAVLLLVALITAAGFWFLRQGKERTEPPMAAVPFTAYRGLVHAPSFSPDGKQVAFQWDGEKQGNFDIYIKQVGSETPRRLTTDPHDDVYPAWSPDGLSIAFQRNLDSKVALMLIPVNGGRERQLAEYEGGEGICWHPNGKWLAISQDSHDDRRAIYLLSLETGEKRRLTSPPRGIGGDEEPAFSPDGRLLAFARGFGGAREIFVLPISAALEPEGDPRQLTFGDRMASSPAWMPDGKELVFLFGSQVTYCDLWRVSVSGSDKPRPLSFSGEDSVLSASVSLENHRLVYSVVTYDINIWRHQMPKGKEKPVPPSRFIPSIQTQEVPQYSPDGRAVAYISYQSGASEIWISSSEGTNPLQLTHLGGPMPELSCWSPDGGQILFSMAIRDQREIFTIPAQGGQARQLTRIPFNKGSECYSRDGKWIYFQWNRNGDVQIWKMPAEGGEPVQVTRKGGDGPQESMDGKTLFYLKGGQSSELWMVPVGGGEETKVLDSILNQNLDVKGHGIYYLSSTDAEKGARLLYYDLASKKTRLLATIQGVVQWGFTVSPDEDWFLLTQGEWTRSNLMLVENFR